MNAVMEGLIVKGIAEPDAVNAESYIEFMGFSKNPIGIVHSKVSSRCFGSRIVIEIDGLIHGINPDILSNLIMANRNSEPYIAEAL